MDIYSNWDKALRNTDIIRSRVQALMTFADTKVPYLFLAESTVNMGDTVVRKGEILVQKPSIILPPNIPQFQGFDFKDETPFEEAAITNFLLVRGIALPSLKYSNLTHSLDMYEGKLNAAITHYLEQLQAKEDVHTGLLTGPEDCWQFSVLIFICSQVAKNADTDIKKLLDEYKKKKGKH